MKAFRVTELGKAPTLDEVDMPEPGPGEVRIKIAACGLNFADLLMITGQYQERPELPFVLGFETAGTVDALGEGAKGLSVGQRVAVAGGTGGLAEYSCVEADRCIPIPDEMSFEDAAAFQVAYGTSHVGLDYKAHLKAGETLLVLGAAGGVGLTAVELGKRMGATVIAVARGADKLAVAKAAGADHLIDSDKDDIRARVKELGGADVVYDPVGGEPFKAALRSVNPEARIIVIGFATGDIPQIPANIVLVKNISVIGHYWGGYRTIKPSVITDSMETLFDWYKQGGLKPHISHTLPLEKAGEALDVLQSRKSTGKVVVTVG